MDKNPLLPEVSLVSYQPDAEAVHRSLFGTGQEPLKLPKLDEKLHEVRNKE